jgi:hypothetical protein
MTWQAVSWVGFALMVVSCVRVWRVSFRPVYWAGLALVIIGMIGAAE